MQYSRNSYLPTYFAFVYFAHIEFKNKISFEEKQTTFLKEVGNLLLSLNGLGHVTKKLVELIIQHSIQEPKSPDHSLLYINSSPFPWNHDSEPWCTFRLPGVLLKTADAKLPLKASWNQNLWGWDLDISVLKVPQLDLKVFKGPQTLSVYHKLLWKC